MLERRRCHPLHILEQVFYIALTMGLSMVVSFGGMELESADEVKSFVFFCVIGAVGLLAIITFFVWLTWLNTWISAEDNTLIVESGILVKRRMTIPFSKINTIDMGRNLFQRLVGTCRLKINTGAIDVSAAQKAEMNLVFSLDDAEEFRSYILTRAAQDESELRQSGATNIIDTAKEPHWVAKAKFSDFMLYGLTSASVTKLLGWLVVAGCFIGEISTAVLVTMGEAAMPYAEALWQSISGSGLIMLALSLLLIVLVVFLVSNAISVAFAAIRFHGFRVAREGDNVVVRYGLFTQKNYTVQAENVHAVVIRQNLFQQIIGRCSVEMVSIGYGNEEKETNLLFPIIQTKKISWLLNALLPEYTLSDISHSPGKRSLGFLIFRPLVVNALLLGAALFGCSFIMESMVLFYIAAAIILVMTLVRGIMRYRGNAIGCDGKVMGVRSGGLHCTTHLIRVDAVQSVSATTGIFQRLRNVASYHVDFHAPALKNIASVSHLDGDILPELDKYIMK